MVRCNAAAAADSLAASRPAPQLTSALRSVAQLTSRSGLAGPNMHKSRTCLTAHVTKIGIGDCKVPCKLMHIHAALSHHSPMYINACTKRFRKTQTIRCAHGAFSPRNHKNGKTYQSQNSRLISLRYRCLGCCRRNSRKN